MEWFVSLKTACRQSNLHAVFVSISRNKLYNATRAFPEGEGGPARAGSDEGYLPNGIGCVRNRPRTMRNYESNPSGEARHHEGIGGSLGSTLVHYGSGAGGSPHPTRAIARPTFPLGEGFGQAVQIWGRIKFLRTAFSFPPRRSPGCFSGTVGGGREWASVVQNAGEIPAVSPCRLRQAFLPPAGILWLKTA